MIDLPNQGLSELGFVLLIFWRPFPPTQSVFGKMAVFRFCTYYNGCPPFRGEYFPIFFPKAHLQFLTCESLDVNLLNVPVEVLFILPILLMPSIDYPCC